jgi:HSP20 family protein
MNSFITLKKSNPLSTPREKNPFTSIQSAVNRAMDDFYNLLDGPPSSVSREIENLIITPSINMVEDKENLKIEAEMPGMGEKDIKVSIGDGYLTIKGEKKVSKKNKDKNYLMREISYGAYERIIPLPDSVDTDKASASFKKSMLWITIPKRAGSEKGSRELAVEKVA